MSIQWTRRDGPPLSYAAESGSEEIVQVLLDVHGIDVNLVDKEGRSPLSYAALWGYEDIVHVLLAVHGIDAHLVDSEGRSPLLYAAGSEFGWEI